MFRKLLCLWAGAMAVWPTGALHAQEPTPAQFRAYWVDAFGEGLYTPAQIDKRVAAAKAANMNAIVAQVGRRGDCF